MPISGDLIDPNDVFSRPWEWMTLTREQAISRCTFVPVIAVHGFSSCQRAELLKNSYMFPVCDPSTSFFTQVGTKHGTGAKGPVPVPMDLSTQGAAFIGGWESLGGFDRTKNLYFPYDDKDPKHVPITPGQKVIGFPTIGYGHLVVAGEDFSKGLTKSQVDQLFVKDSAKAVKHVNKLLTVKVSQQQFDAVMSLAFNAGFSRKTPPIRHLNAGKAVTKDDFVKHYTTSGGVFMKGLLKRRTAEWNMLSKGVYDSSH